MKYGRRKGLGKQYNGIDKLNADPGGWGCPCCNPYYCHPKNMKANARRLTRRAMKQLLKKDEKNIDNE